MTARTDRRGFSFVELLFSMAVLSVGLIGVAAAVYVGVNQTKATVDETTAASVARQAAATLSQIMTRDNTSETGDQLHAFGESVSPMPGALQAATAGSQISAADPRFAFVPLYRRRSEAPIAELLIVVVHAEARSAFDAKDLTNYDVPANEYVPTLCPSPATVDVTGNEIRIDTPLTGTGRVAAGTIVVLANVTDPLLNGRVLRVSGPGDNGRWQLAPGDDLAGVTTSLAGTAHVIGRGYKDVTQPRQGYAGASQAVAVYSTIIALR